jgi:hypothetical protein
MKYQLEIDLMEFIILSLRPEHFSEELLKLIVLNEIWSQEYKNSQ